MAKHLLKDMTFIEFRERMARGTPVILIPLGSQEEQGPTAPMGDWMLAEALAGEVARRADAIAAPTIPFGFGDYFRPVPGGVQLRAATMRALLRDVIDNFLDHGLDRLLIFNGHTGNNPCIDEVSRLVRAERGVIVPWLNIWRSITPEIWREAHGPDAAKAQGHGADPLNSVYMHLFPALLRPDLAQAPNPGGTVAGLPTAGLTGVKFRGIEMHAPVTVADHAPNGIVGGDPARASAAAGERIARHVIDTGVGLVQHLQTADLKG